MRKLLSRDIPRVCLVTRRTLSERRPKTQNASPVHRNSLSAEGWDLFLKSQFSSRRVAAPLIIMLVVSTLLSIQPSILSVSASNCNGTSVPDLVPLNDLGNSTYLGLQGGLYSNASNSMPRSHLDAGLKLAQRIVPLNKTGNPSSTGKIVLVSIGMSNTLIETNGLISLAKSDTSVNPSMVIVNGAEGGEDAHSIVTNPAPYWKYVDNQLANNSVTPQQVEAAWLKEADANPTGSQITYAQTLSSQLVTVLQMMLQNFPNLKLVYLSSRTYAGYASTTLNPEPYAYTSSFSVRWTIQAQLNGTSSMNFNASKGPVVAPWVAWGPYMWANGLVARSDGLTWTCSDFQSDGTHPSIPQGQMKVANILMTFFKSDPTTHSWFTTGVSSVGGTSTSISNIFLLALYTGFGLIVATILAVAISVKRQREGKRQTNDEFSLALSTIIDSSRLQFSQIA